MTAPVVRRLRLPAARGSPAAARVAIREAVTAAGLDAVLDEALLLATELVTNSIVHVGDELELEIEASTEAITVTVLDPQRMPPELPGRSARAGPPARNEHLAERGRGLLLVDRLADCWGTLHHRDGKGVWFRLAGPKAGPDGPDGADGTDVPTPQRLTNAKQIAASDGSATAAAVSAGRSPDAAAAVPASEPADAAAMPASEAADAAAVSAGEPLGHATDREAATLRAAFAALGPFLDGSQDRVDPAEIGARLLRGLCEATGASSGVILLDEGDGRGVSPIAAHGHSTHGRWEPESRLREPADRQRGLDGQQIRQPLGLTRPWRGELLLAGVDSTLAGPYARLTAERLTLLIENHRLRRAGAARRAWLTFLAEASELLAQSLDVDLTLALIPRLLVPRLGQWCAVHLTDGEGDLRLAAATHADEAQLPDLLATLHAAVSRVRDALHTDAAVPLPAPVDGYAVALIARGQQLGTLTVGPGSQTWPRTEEVAVVEDVARRAALAIDNARIHADRREIAQTLQRSLLPPQLPKVAGIEFGAEYVPTGEGVDVGGDFYDVVEVSEQSWLVVVGDVSGKGIQAATVTGLVRDVTRVLVRDGRPVAEILTRLNQTLVERGGGRFCTLALAAVSRRADGLLDVALHLAGHDRPLLVAGDGTVSPVGRCGTALGLLEAGNCPAADLVLAPGDTLVFFTDGVTERRRGKTLFGHERLQREASSLAGFPAEVMAARLRSATLGFTHEAPRDDIAIFTLRNDGAR